MKHLCVGLVIILFRGGGGGGGRFKFVTSFHAIQVHDRMYVGPFFIFSFLHREEAALVKKCNDGSTDSSTGEARLTFSSDRTHVRKA